DRGGDVRDVPDLSRQVRCHRVDAVGQLAPGAGDVFDDRLPAQLAVGADFARHAGHFRGERAELIDHRVDGVLELEDLALDVDSDLLGEVPLGHGGRYLGDV